VYWEHQTAGIVTTSSHLQRYPIANVTVTPSIFWVRWEGYYNSRDEEIFVHPECLSNCSVIDFQQKISSVHKFLWVRWRLESIYAVIPEWKYRASCRSWFCHSIIEKRQLEYLKWSFTPRSSQWIFMLQGSSLKLYTTSQRKVIPGCSWQFDNDLANVLSPDYRHSSSIFENTRMAKKAFLHPASSNLDTRLVHARPCEHYHIRAWNG